MNSVFLDTSGLVALLNKRDQNHGQATAFWRSIIERAVTIYMTDYVFDETYTLLRNAVGHDLAVGFGELTIESEALQLINVDESLFRDAWEIARRYSDKSYSFTDCASFAVMNQLGLTDVFSFDSHFAQQGFAMHPH